MSTLNLTKCILFFSQSQIISSDQLTVPWFCFHWCSRFVFQHVYNKADCTFREQILADGYNVYTSDGHGVPLSLGTKQQRLQGVDRGAPALARFLPRINTLQQTLSAVPDVPDPPGTAQTDESMDVMDSFGKLSQIIHSPSFHKSWGSSAETTVKGCVHRLLPALESGWPACKEGCSQDSAVRHDWTEHKTNVLLSGHFVL